MRISWQRRRGRPVDTEAQLVDPVMPECRAILNRSILIPRLVQSREPRHIGAWRRPAGWNMRRTVIYGVAREQRMGAGEVMVDADHAVVLTGVAFVSGDQ